MERLISSNTVSTHTKYELFLGNYNIRELWSSLIDPVGQAVQIYNSSFPLSVRLQPSPSWNPSQSHPNPNWAAKSNTALPIRLLLLLSSTLNGHFQMWISILISSFSNFAWINLRPVHLDIFEKMLKVFFQTHSIFEVVLISKFLIKPDRKLKVGVWTTYDSTRPIMEIKFEVVLLNRIKINKLYRIAFSFVMLERWRWRQKCGADLTDKGCLKNKTILRYSS